MNIQDSRSAIIKNKLQEVPGIKVFVSNHLDELQQIVDMSVKTAILMDQPAKIGEFMEGHISRDKGLFRKYFIDWNGKLPKEDVSKLSRFNVSTIKALSENAVIDKVELYLSGKVTISRNKATGVSFNEGFTISKGYFTHIKFEENDWNTMLSSHELEEDMMYILGQDWDSYMSEAISTVSASKKIVSKMLKGGQLYEILYPHMVDNQLAKISIVHLKTNDPYDEMIHKVKSFLGKI